MLELYLVRHGIAAERGPEYPDDSKRPLTGKGIAALRNEAKALNALKVSFDVIIASPLTRTRQTAEVLAEHLVREADRRVQRRAGAGGHAGRGHSGDWQPPAQGAHRAGRARAEHRRAGRAADWRAVADRVQEGRDLPHRLRGAAAEVARHAAVVSAAADPQAGALTRGSARVIRHPIQFVIRAIRCGRCAARRARLRCRSRRRHAPSRRCAGRSPRAPSP